MIAGESQGWVPDMAELSFGVDQLLGALEREVVGEATAARWLAALAGRERDAVESAAGGRDVDALVGAAGEGGEALTRLDVAGLATDRAAAAGRPVASTADLAAALIDVAATEPPGSDEHTDSVVPPSPPQPPEPVVDDEDRPEADEVPLSFSAEQLLDALLVRPTGLFDLVLTLADEHDDALAAAETDVESASVVDDARRRSQAGDGGESWDRDRLEAAAARRAAAAGRPVVSPGDLAAALLTAASEAGAPSEPSAEPEPNEPEPTAAEREVPDTDASPASPVEELVADNTKKELLVLAEREGVSVAKSATKARIAEAIVAAREAAKEGTGAGPDAGDEGVVHAGSAVEAKTESEGASAAEAGQPPDAASEGASGAPRTFRLFVSSTFQDLEAERNVLREQVYPALTKFCSARNARFQAIDLRWGVSEEAGFDQQAMQICLGEIDRCRKITPRPNFLVLLGNRYGWLALPAHIPADEFGQILEQVEDGDRKFLEGWYRLDENEWPTPEYRLLPRVGKGRPEGHPDRPKGNEAAERTEEKAWEEAEARLHAILTSAVAALEFDAERRRVYETSATHQEIQAGALRDDQAGPAFAFIREIGLDPDKGDPDPGEAAEGDPILRFVDEEEVGPVEERTGRLAVLKQALDPITRGRYQAEWRGREGGPSTDHLQDFATDVLTTLTASIEQELEHRTRREREEGREVRIESDEHLGEEGEAHRDFAEGRIQVFEGREQLRADIDAFLDADDPRPLVIHGGGGTGKSALLAKAVHEAQQRAGTEELVYRFVGATPGSADGRALLESLCRELARRYGTDESTVPSDFQDLSADFKERLEAASADRPLVVFIDSLDQLAAGSGARRLAWIPQPVPDNVRLVVSTRPGDTLEPLRVRFELEGSDRLLEVGPMSRQDGEKLLTRWLTDAGRTLQDEQRAAVLDAFGGTTDEDPKGELAARGNPLYLQLAFEEARRWVSDQDPEPLHHTELDEDGEPQAAVEALIERNTFHRLAEELNHGEVLLSHALGYLAASRYGLAEDELVDLLSRDPDVYAWFVLKSFHVPLDLRDRLETYLTGLKPELRDQAVERDERERQEAEAELMALPDPLEPERADIVGEWVRQLRDGERDREELVAFLETVSKQGGEGLRLPVVLWSRLWADLRPYLTERAVEGAVVIDFYHRELRDVAERRYNPEAGDEKRAAGTTLHARMADYFKSGADPEGDGTWATDDEGGVDLRGLSELPFHLTGAEDWDRVYDTLTDFTFLERKAAEVAVTEEADGDVTTKLYRGVFALQDDFDTALAKMPGGDGADGDRRRLIVTVADVGEGLALRCPHCNTSHPAQGECPVCGTEHDLDRWTGEEISCPNHECKGPLKVNDFVVERT